MEQRAEFLKKLSGLVDLAKTQDSQISVEEVNGYFAEEGLNDEQLDLVFDYLLAQKVVVKGYVKIQEEKPLELTGEEAEYLKEYEEDLKAFPELAESEKKELFAAVAAGNKGHGPQSAAEKERATEKLINGYLHEVVEIAKKLHNPDVFLGDLIQEGNLGLVMAVSGITNPDSAHEEILAKIRESMDMFLEEHADADSKDKKIVEKVQALDESITALTEELGRKVTLDELAVYMGMTEDEITDILKLAGEDTPEDEEAGDDSHHHHHDHDCGCGHHHEHEEES